MHEDLLQLQVGQNLQWPKTQISRPWYFETIFDRCLGAYWPKLIISREYFWVIILFLDRNDINNFGPKDHLSKTIPILRSDASIWKAFYGTCRCPEQIKKMKKRTKEKIIVMSCTWKIRLSLNENQECRKMQKKMMKNRINMNHFPLARNHSSV